MSRLSERLARVRQSETAALQRQPVPAPARAGGSAPAVAAPGALWGAPPAIRLSGGGPVAIQRAALANAGHMAPGGAWFPTTDAQGRAKKIVATNLKLKSGYTLPGPGHNSPSVDPPSWTWLNQNSLTHGSGPPNYVRMHLLNGQLGGPGNNVNNLAPGTASLNSHHLAHLESEAQSWLSQGGTISRYEVELTYNGASGNLAGPAAKSAWQDTITHIEGDFDYIHYVNNQQQTSTTKRFISDEDPGLDTKPNWQGK